jgi:hypothetical protein
MAFVGFWTYAELSMSVVCSCLPYTPRFFQAVGQKLFTLAGSSSSTRTNLGGSKLKWRKTRVQRAESDEV